MEAAVADLNSVMSTDLENNLTSRWLFPNLRNITDIPPRWITESKNSHDRLRWKDKDLNDEQKVNHIIEDDT